MSTSGTSQGKEHIGALVGALSVLNTRLLDDWGQRLALAMSGGRRLFTAGNGGSAAQAQHLTAEFTGKFYADQPPYSAIALHAETPAVTAIANDYGYDEVFARLLRAHGRAGDVLLSLSTSGRSRNVLRAVTAARELGLATWALTGPAPNPLADACDEAVCVQPGGAPVLTATVQEAHQVALHLVCLAFDATVADLAARARAGTRADSETDLNQEVAGWTM
jgi:D-sedoheptulose 7-phosphate isomerase